jgi:hypothetical protein
MPARPRPGNGERHEELPRWARSNASVAMLMCVVYPRKLKRVGGSSGGLRDFAPDCSVVQVGAGVLAPALSDGAKAPSVEGATQSRNAVAPFLFPRCERGTTQGPQSGAGCLVGRSEAASAAEGSERVLQRTPHVPSAFLFLPERIHTSGDAKAE